MTSSVTPPTVGYARPVAVPTMTAAGFQPQSGDSLLQGWSFAETTGGATASIIIFDGNDTTGTPIAFVNLQPSESTRDVMAGLGIQCRTGVWVQVVAGTARGSVWLVDI